MHESELSDIIADQRHEFFGRRGLIERDMDLTPYIETGQIVVISGVRRSGKSSLLRLIHDKMRLSPENALYFNFDDERLVGFGPEDFNRIYALHLELLPADARNFVFFLDEIQNVTGWEQFLSRMQQRGFKIFVTGSNANLLSSEIATALTGRNMVLELFPFSFSEYLRITGKSLPGKLPTTEEKASAVRSFREYVEIGGFPLVIQENSTLLLKSYFRDILYRDIITRYSLEQVGEMRALVTYMASNISRLASLRKLQAACGIKSLSTLRNYLGYLEEAFLFFLVPRFDPSIKKQLAQPRKVYLVDTGFYGEIGFRGSDDIGHLLENVVFIELLRRGYEVFYHHGKTECDFICRENMHLAMAIQVSQSLASENVQKRETDGLIEAMETYNVPSGMILTENENNELLINGRSIRIMPIWRWLLENERS